MPSPYYYYVNAFDSTYTQWTVNGASPYLGAIDYPANYITMAGNFQGFKEGIFDFPNSGAENGETLQNVFVEVYHKSTFDPDLGCPAVTAFVYDGSSWTSYDVSNINDSVWEWISADISAVINTWAKLDACRVYLQYDGYVSSYGTQVDCMRLKATTAAPPAVGAKRRLLVGVGL